MSYERYWSDPLLAPPERDPTLEQRWKLLREHMLRRLVAGAQVLDVGSGGGLFAGRLRAVGYRITAMDLALAPLRLLSVRDPHVSLVCASADSAWPFIDEAFALIWASEVIEHLVDVRAFVREAARVLEAGGWLILTTPYHGLLKNVVIALVGFDRHFDVEGYHLRFFTVRSLRRLLESEGFVVNRVATIGRVAPIAMSMFIVARKAGSSDIA